MTTSQLSPSVTTFFELMDAPDKTLAIDVFDDGASVADNDSSYHGRDAILEWLRGDASEYTYTSTELASSQTDNVAKVARLLEGDFPGGRAELHYTFDLAPSGLIRELSIVA